MFYFPHPFTSDSDGLLAIGGDLSIDRLLLAYRFGIFPWYNDAPILWWWTHPRCVLYPADIKVSKSMRSYFNQEKFKVTYNQHFDYVIRECSYTKRPRQIGTWISSDIIDSYTQLHQLGYAHSVEVWEGNHIVGGLYGLALGRIFYGESMFAHVSNASKFGFITLARQLERDQFRLIDCQQKTDHLLSLGATMVKKETFWQSLKNNLLISDEKWSAPQTASK